MKGTAMLCRNGFLFTELVDGGISLYYEPHCECGPAP